MNSSSLRARLGALVESAPFTRAILALILLNAVLLGIETYPSVTAKHGNLLAFLDRLILAVFVGELSLKVFVHRRDFFRDPWNIFDAAVVAIALQPAGAAFSVLRTARVFRILRLISAFPRLRKVVQGLIHAMPGVGSIGALLLITMYVFAVMTTRLFGADHPQWFGSLQASTFTLFQIMTVEGWPEIARAVMVTHPHAWILFVLYILTATFTVLNLFVAVIVDAMQRSHQEPDDRAGREALEGIRADIAALHRKLDGLRDGGLPGEGRAERGC